MQANHDLHAINAMDKATFTRALGDVFEHSPEVAEAAWEARPFPTVAALHDAMMAAIRRRDEAAQTAFLCRHPPLSARAIRAGALTEASSAEQKSAGLDGLAESEEAQLQSMNQAYQVRHGFPFIICVRHYTRDGIFFELEKRTGRSTARELEEALDHVQAITRGRLQRCIGFAAGHPVQGK
ncbi:2-oxo-4-hydroxy-4-carboxy-5-ureidoimidazoline decarboxylase [Cupriavidus sp. 2MCAB6]|uniref:2-oxo-4-hydroxy-4-carboxy-5-ureidoimidazoline decarboxylase n=1 Tax=Cupriavidus sp. 2MCAB6 TaxID=3232981 RepID=UPI003F8E30B9